jgi:hypothetical protein
MRPLHLCLFAALLPVASAQDCLTWDVKRVTTVGRSMRVNGQVGGADWRVLRTDRSYNYKLRATWLTPEVICASARLSQMSQGLTDQQMQALISEATNVNDTVILVEIDPREGSGVIPNEWTALLRPRIETGDSTHTVKGTSVPKLRDVRALAGTERRDYAYDVFWVVFALNTPDGKPLFADADREAELVVRIYDKIGRVRWPVPDSIRRTISSR